MIMIDQKQALKRYREREQNRIENRIGHAAMLALFAIMVIVGTMEAGL